MPIAVPTPPITDGLDASFFPVVDAAAPAAPATPAPALVAVDDVPWNRGQGERVVGAGADYPDDIGRLLTSLGDQQGKRVPRRLMLESGGVRLQLG